MADRFRRPLLALLAASSSVSAHTVAVGVRTAPPFPSVARTRPPVAISSLPPSNNGMEPDFSKRAKRWLYNTLAPLDKGDFRWEFLVPFNNKTLTTLDKFIVCSTFIGLSFAIQTLTDPGASVGVHLSYIAQFFSYAIGDPIGYRSLAVLTSMLEILGNLFEEKSQGLFVSGLPTTTPDFFEAQRATNDEDLFPIFYDQLFIFINGYYILRWLLGREQIALAQEWTEEEEALYTKCFAGLGFRRAQFSRLLRSAQFVQLQGESGRSPCRTSPSTTSSSPYPATSRCESTASSPPPYLRTSWLARHHCSRICSRPVGPYTLRHVRRLLRRRVRAMSDGRNLPSMSYSRRRTPTSRKRLHTHTHAVPSLSQQHCTQCPFHSLSG